MFQPTTRPRPQTWACTGRVGGSPGSAATAPEVSTHSGGCASACGRWIPASPRAWTRLRVAARPPATAGRSGSGVSSSASSESTPLTRVTPARSTAAASASGSPAPRPAG
ncbi:hypothetical protein GXW82_03370 [Streptacidiphilus sp. 4-A2]|nr:hypothetical protein [Streptacidiphilus sp. 4-A2]